MESITRLTATVVKETARVIDTTGVNTMADIGVAGGAMRHTLLQLHADLHSIVFDCP